jgi:hypothetical protein
MVKAEYCQGYRSTYAVALGDVDVNRTSLQELTPSPTLAVNSLNEDVEDAPARTLTAAPNPASASVARMTIAHFIIIMREMEDACTIKDRI